MDNHSERALSFGRQASLYERLRPGYPAEAIDELLSRRGRRVVDVGAGTGKLTAALADAGHEVVAVEPDPDMRATLTERLPGIDVRDGAGESLPLEDHSADAIFYGQSWHWVEPAAGAREARRVLTEDGILALVWNIPDTRQRWVKELLAITHPGRNPARDMEPVVITGFRPGTLVRTPWQQWLTPAEVVELAGTWSRIATSPPGQRDALLDAVRDVVTTHPDLLGAAEIGLPYVCAAYHYQVG
jgi:SAM-dependent methyltransferase